MVEFATILDILTSCSEVNSSAPLRNEKPLLPMTLSPRINGMDRDAFMRLPVLTRSVWYAREAFLKSPCSEGWVLWANLSIRAGERDKCLAEPSSALYRHLLPQAESAALLPLPTGPPEPPTIPVLHPVILASQRSLKIMKTLFGGAAAFLGINLILLGLYQDHWAGIVLYVGGGAFLGAIGGRIMEGD